MDFLYKHLVIVHGIGDQLGNETSISFMNEFIRSLPQKARDTVEVHNLVERIDFGPKAAARPAYVTFTHEDSGAKRDYVLAFSEVYWQPVPNDYLQTNDHNPPVPVFVWAHSINTRLLHGGPKYQRAREAIDNLETMLKLLERLAAIYRKSGLLANVLTKFLCDVQMYVEAEDLRAKINGRFLDVMGKVNEMRTEIARQLAERSQAGLVAGTDIYIVAHSEGTVVSYDSLISAAAEREKDAALYAWLPQVRALITLGSPLDKHYTIWRNRFRTDVLTTTSRAEKDKISWRNYWDRSDPVGYGLRVLFAPPASDAARLFSVTRDAAFTRYPIPGKAHVDYWRDDQIHADILHEIVKGGSNDSKVVDKPWRFLQVPVDYLGYVVGRVATVAAFIFFLNRVLSPVRGVLPLGWLAAIPGFPSGDHPNLAVPFWALTLPIAVNGVLEMDRDWSKSALRSVHATLWNMRVSWPLTIEWMRQLAIAAWSTAVLALSVGLTVFDPNTTSVSIKDWIGYAIGLVSAILAWKLHTTVHTGLLQLWRYTGGSETSYVATSAASSKTPQSSKPSAVKARTS